MRKAKPVAVDCRTCAYSAVNRAMNPTWGLCRIRDEDLTFLPYDRAMQEWRTKTSTGKRGVILPNDVCRFWTRTDLTHNQETFSVSLAIFREALRNLKAPGNGIHWNPRQVSSEFRTKREPTSTDQSWIIDPTHKYFSLLGLLALASFQIDVHMIPQTVMVVIWTRFDSMESSPDNPQVIEGRETSMHFEVRQWEKGPGITRENIENLLLDCIACCETVLQHEDHEDHEDDHSGDVA